MNQMHFTKRAAVLSGLFTIVILCGMMLCAASTSNGGNLITQSKAPEELLEKELLQFENVNNALVSFGAPDNDTRMTYVFIIADEEIRDSEISNITEYIQEYLDDFKNGQISITYVDPSYKVLQEVYPEIL